MFSHLKSRTSTSRRSNTNNNTTSSSRTLDIYPYHQHQRNRNNNSNLPQQQQQQQHRQRYQQRRSSSSYIKKKNNTIFRYITTRRQQQPILIYALAGISTALFITTLILGTYVTLLQFDKKGSSSDGLNSPLPLHPVTTDVVQQQQQQPLRGSKRRAGGMHHDNIPHHHPPQQQQQQQQQQNPQTPLDNPTNDDTPPDNNDDDLPPLITPSDLLPFSPTDHATLPFTLDCLSPHPEETMLSFWIIPSPDVGTSRRTTLIKTQRGGCHTPGLSLYFSHTPSETTGGRLVLEYPSVVAGCSSITTNDARIPMGELSHVGLSLHSHRGCRLSRLRLYVNGRIVGVSDKNEDLAMEEDEGAMMMMMNEDVFVRNNGGRDAEEGRVTVVGGEGWVGRVGMVVVWSVGVEQGGGVVEERGDWVMKAAFRVGFDEGELRSLKREGLVVGEPIYMYPFNGLEDKKLDATALLPEQIQSTHGTLYHTPSFDLFTPLGPNRYPLYKTGSSPTPHILPSTLRASHALARSRRIHIRNAIKHAWDGYTKYALAKDELDPLGKVGRNNWGGLATTLVTSLDTLRMAELTMNYDKALLELERYYETTTFSGSVNVADITRNILGGLLSAHDLAPNDNSKLLSLAETIGTKLLSSFDSESGIPYGRTLLNGDNRSYNGGGMDGNGGVSLRELFLELEFRVLAKRLERSFFSVKVTKGFHHFSHKNEKIMTKDGLFVHRLSNESPHPVGLNDRIVMEGAFYGEVLSVWLWSGRQEGMYRKLYDRAVEGMIKVLLDRTEDGFVFLREMEGGVVVDEGMDDRACDVPGILALGAYTHPSGLESTIAKRDLRIAKAMAYTCYQMYARTLSGLTFHSLSSSFLRSLYILHSLTHDPTYREWGWEIFQALEKSCKLETGGYGALKDEEHPEKGVGDRMEPEFLGGTLKYLYLLMDPDAKVDVLTTHVFNAAGHLFRIL